MRIFGFISTLFLSATVLARPLYFQADVNGVKIIPQKFEYGLIDSEKIRIGDILIDASTFNFQLEPINKSFALKFRWPAGLISEGELLLLNNNGKALWTQKITPAQVKITPVISKIPHLRAELAEYTSQPVEVKFVNELRLLPFMNFCISYREPETKIYLCSKELYVSVVNRKPVVKDRTATKQQPLVMINGKPVGQQGIIFLNNKRENIFVKATAESGAYLEIDTRLNDVDFRDVVESNDGNYLIVTASGAEPVSKVQMLGKELWRTKVRKDRPILYLKGSGGIPMRQEFFVSGKVPKENLRVSISDSAPTQTTSSSVTVTGTYPAKTKIAHTNKADRLQLSGNEFKWDVNELSSGRVNRRYLRLETEDGKYFARYDIERNSSYFFEAGGLFDLPSNIFYGFLKLQWWLNGNSAADLETNLHFTTKAGYPELNIYRLSYFYKFGSGSYLDDDKLEDTWGLALPITMISGSGLSLTSFGLKIWSMKKAPEFVPAWIKWQNPYFIYMAGASGNGVNFSGGQELGINFYSPVNESRFITYGFRLLNLAFDPSFSEQKMQLGFSVGYSGRL